MNHIKSKHIAIIKQLANDMQQYPEISNIHVFQRVPKLTFFHTPTQFKIEVAIRFGRYEVSAFNKGSVYNKFLLFRDPYGFKPTTNLRDRHLMTPKVVLSIIGTHLQTQFLGSKK